MVVLYVRCSGTFGNPFLSPACDVKSEMKAAAAAYVARYGNTYTQSMKKACLLLVKGGDHACRRRRT